MDTIAAAKQRAEYWKAEHLKANAEIDRLTACLKKANEQTEHFKRNWYLRGDVLERIQQWANAYPLEAFPEPDFNKAHELLKAGGMTLDAITASNMRHVITSVKKLVDDVLGA